MILRHMSGACYCQAKEQSFRGKMGNRQSIYLSAPVYVYVCERERERRWGERVVLDTTDS